MLQKEQETSIHLAQPLEVLAEDEIFYSDKYFAKAPGVLVLHINVGNMPWWRICSKYIQVVASSPQAYAVYSSHSVTCSILTKCIHSSFLYTHALTNHFKRKRCTPAHSCNYPICQSRARSAMHETMQVQIKSLTWHQNWRKCDQSDLDIVMVAGASGLVRGFINYWFSWDFY